MRGLFRVTGTIGAVAVMLAASGCQSLDVVNPNDPDASRALSDPGGVYAVAGGTLRSWFNTTQSMEAAGPLTTMADSYTASWNNFNMRLYSSVPRAAWANDPSASARTSVEWYWYGYYSALSSANDVLAAIRVNGLEIFTPEQTKQTETIATMMQGILLGDLSLQYDQAFIVTDSSDLASLVFSPREEVRDAALAKLDAAIALANANSFETPAEWTNGTSYSNTEIAKIANTAAARILAYFPRSLAENATVDWARVATYASNGMSSGTPFNLTFTGDGGCPDLTGLDERGFCDELKLWSNDPTTMRMDTRISVLLDPATQSTPWPFPGGSPPPNSPDKRLGDGSFGDADFADVIDGIPATANAGTDYAWSSRAIFNPTRGSYHQSNITHVRYVTAGFADPTGNSGCCAVNPVITATENDLLWAEGLIRSGGSLVTAAAKINNTRVTRGGLSPATAADLSTGLLVKLQYEQDIELPGLGATPYFNRRRIDGLLPTTPRHMPVPAKELGVLQQELYTFGGPSAPEFSRSSGALSVHDVYRALQRETGSTRRLH